MRNALKLSLHCDE